MPSERPLWVRVGLWGVPNRASAWVFVWVSMLAAMGCVAMGYVDPLFAWGALFMVASIWYYAALRWMDRHDGWP